MRELIRERLTEIARERAHEIEMFGALAADEAQEIEEREVLILVVHPTARLERERAVRQSEWVAWYFGKWIDFNGGGYTWDGMCGFVAFVARVP